MSRNKQGVKVGREARNRAFQEQLRKRKRLRRQRANADIYMAGDERLTVTATQVVNERWTIGGQPVAEGAIEQHAEAVSRSITFGEIPPVRSSRPLGEVERTNLRAMSVPTLREIAKQRGVTFTTRTRKADLIDLIVGAS